MDTARAGHQPLTWSHKQRRWRPFRTASSSHILGKPRLWKTGSGCFSPCLALWSCLCLLDARLPWQQTGAVIWRCCPFYPGCLNSSLKLVVGRERGQTKSQTICCQLLTAWPAAVIPPVHGECRSTEAVARGPVTDLSCSDLQDKISKTQQTVSVLKHLGFAPSSTGSVVS